MGLYDSLCSWLLGLLRCLFCCSKSKSNDVADPSLVNSGIAIHIDSFHGQPSPPPGAPPTGTTPRRDGANPSSQPVRTKATKMATVETLKKSMKHVIRRTSHGSSDADSNRSGRKRRSAAYAEASLSDSSVGEDTTRSSMEDPEESESLTWMKAPRVVSALEEVVRTEGDYVLALRTLAEGYRPKLAPALEPGEEKRIFGNSQSLLGAHAYLLERVENAMHGTPEERARSCPPPRLRLAIAQTAAAFQTMLPFLKLYATYCANYVSALETLERGDDRLDYAAWPAEPPALLGITGSGWLLMPPPLR